MKWNPSKGIEGLLKDGKHLKLQDIIKIHDRLLKEFPMPRATIENIQGCKPESRLLLNIDELPLPSVDVFKGTLKESNESGTDRRIYASFRTSNNVAIVPVSHMKGNQYCVKIPHNAVNGLLGIIFPIRESFGPSKIIQAYPPEIIKWISKSNHISGWDVTKEDCPPSAQPSEDVRYLAMVVPEPFNFHFSVTCPVCPHGAIKINPTYCYVDPHVCKGQKYSKPRSEETEEICWDCFNTGDDTVSSKCHAVTIRKVLHLNPEAPKKEVPCCGKDCGIFELCPRGAVQLEPMNPGVYGKFWYADKKLCNGCMNCYHGFTCDWNCGTSCNSDCGYYERDSNIMFYDGEGGFYNRDIRPNYTIRMVAQIDNRLKLVLVKLEFQSWAQQFYRRGVPGEIPFSSDDGTFEDFDLIIWAEGMEKIPIRLDKNSIHDFGMREVPFTQRIHLGLFQKDGNLLGFQYCGANLPIRSIGGKRYADPTKLIEGGHLKFNTPMGRIQIEYRIK
jgi:hypothetical protein